MISEGDKIVLKDETFEGKKWSEVDSGGSYDIAYSKQQVLEVNRISDTSNYPIKAKLPSENHSTFNLKICEVEMANKTKQKISENYDI